MSVLLLAAVWGACGLAALPAARRLRRHRAAAVLLLAAGLAGAAAATVAPWPGPAASTGYGATLALGRPALGALVGAGVALAACTWLAPAYDQAAMASAAVAGAAVVVVGAATVPVIWALALAVAVGSLTVRWIAVAPGRGTLATGRVAGLGAAALLGGAAMLPVSVGDPGARPIVAGALIAGGIAALVGLVPVGGWAAAAVAALPGPDLAVWALLVAPAVLLSGGAVLDGVPTATRAAAATDLLVLALVSALLSGLQAVLAAAPTRYGRLLLVDLALAAAGVASLHDAGRLGALLLILSHLVVGPLLLNAPRPGLERVHRLAWFGIGCLPPCPGFWGRLLVLQALAAVSGPCLAAGLGAVALGGAAFLRALADPRRPAGTPAGAAVRALAGGVCVAAAALAVAPGAIAERVFGLPFG